MKLLNKYFKEELKSIYDDLSEFRDWKNNLDSSLFERMLKFLKIRDLQNEQLRPE